MRNTVSFLKNTIDKSGDGIRKCFLIKNGQIYTYGSRMTAGARLSTILPITCNVPSDETESALSRMSTDPEIMYEENVLTLRSGKLRATINCLDADTPDCLLIDNSIQWHPSPMLLPLDLKKALPFVGDRGAFNGIRLKGNRITAMTTFCGININLKDLNIEPEITITKECAELLAKQDSPESVASSETMFCCKWRDYRWLRAQILTNSMPDSVDEVFARADKDTPIYITEEWRNAFADISSLTDKNITIHSGGFIGTKGVGRIDIEFNTGVPEDHVSHWSIRALKPLMECGTTKWNPMAYPNIVRFEGPNFSGIVMGVQL